ncbi:MAG: Hpt domain-containing protein [Lachnospiraceae bacterium]|nr:Hpt domain-containing protein [Lachnospiraceae bacterium]
MLYRYIPESKITTPKKENDPQKTMLDKTVLRSLKNAGINTNLGMKYSMNDPSIYESILKAFVTESSTKMQNLRDCYEAKDLNGYTTYIHSLKSSAKTIGAIALNELAARLEDAAKNQTEEIIDKDHDKVMKIYSDLVEVIRHNLMTDNDTESDEYNDVMEFLPE